MGQAVFELFLGLREEDDKDHYANKRLKLAGDDGRTPVPIAEVEPAKEIVKRFSTGAMNSGSM